MFGVLIVLRQEEVFAVANWCSKLLDSLAAGVPLPQLSNRITQPLEATGVPLGIPAPKPYKVKLKVTKQILPENIFFPERVRIQCSGHVVICSR